MLIRIVVFTTVLLLPWNGAMRAEESVALPPDLDHLVYATSDLERTVDLLEKKLGVRATPGGPHPGRGTRNALLALGPTCYLEIIGPDPAQPTPEKPRWFGIDRLKEAGLVSWVSRGEDLKRLVIRAHRRGIPLGEVVAGSRKRSDGTVISWQVTDLGTMVADGIFPSFIDWGGTPHPARSASAGLTLLELRAEHPDTARVRGMLSRFGIPLEIKNGTKPVLVATIIGPRGRVELR